MTSQVLSIVAESSNAAKVIGALLAFTLLRAYVRRRQTIAATPPGPPLLPIFDNFFAIPSAAPWKTYMEWGRQYKSEYLCDSGIPALA